VSYNRAFMKTARVASSILLALGAAASSGAAPVTYAVDDAKSAVRVHVGKAGAFSFAGHRHQVEAPVTGTVTADAESLAASSVDLTFAGARMRVLPEGEPAGDAPKVEEIMKGPKVLDLARFPDVRFRSKAVSGRAISGGAYELTLVGDLALHGVTRELTLPVKVAIDGDSLVAEGRAILRHDQFGMTPVSAARGTVKVANEIRIDVRIVARPR
jgi:polyisoprenoid-binding protein YceI